MTDHEKLVMRNIIYAVETGGQVYGQKNYADYEEEIEITPNKRWESQIRQKMNKSKEPAPQKIMLFFSYCSLIAFLLSAFLLSASLLSTLQNSRTISCPYYFVYLLYIHPSLNTGSIHLPL